MSVEIPLDRLNAWPGLRDLPGDGPFTAAAELPGGSQNLLFTLVRADGTELVLRRPGRHAGDEAAARFARESRVLTALAGTPVPHPRLHASCPDEAVIGVPFSILAKVVGFTPKGPLPGRYGEADPAWRRAMAFELVGGAATLGSVDPKAAGLDGFGHPDGWLERQVPRYLSMLEAYRASPGYRQAPQVAGVAEWLRAHRPGGFQVGIVHGDFQFANVMYALDEPRLTAIVDWEMGSLGDPLLDLAWILTAWREEGDPPGSDPYLQPWDGMPTSAELIDHYARLTGRDLADFRWYRVLACFRLAALLEGSYARALSGRLDRELGDTMHAYAAWLWAKADLEIARR